MNYELIALGVIVFFSLASSIFYLQKRPDRILLLIPIGLSLGGFNVYGIGTIWNPVKVITLFASLYLIFVDFRWNKIINITKNQSSKIFILCLLLSFLVSYLFEPQNVYFYGSGGLRGLLFRPLIQTYTYVSKFSIFPLALISFTNKENIKQFFNVYIWTAVIEAAIAIYQLITLQTGGSFMPILRALGEDSEVAGFALGGLHLQRLYAFAGEPKQLAVFLLPAIFAVLSAITIKVPVEQPKWAKLWILLLLVFVYIFTFSTAGMIAIVLGSILLTVILFQIQPATVKKIAMSLIVAFLFLNISFQLFIVNSQSPVSNIAVQTLQENFAFSKIFYERSIGRLDQELEDRKETKGLKLIFQDKVIALPLGVGPGMYNFHIPEMHFGRGVNQINSGWVVLLLDTGLIGVSLFLFWLFNIIHRSFQVTLFWIKQGEWNSVYYLPSAIAGLLGAIFCHLGIGAFESIILFAGLTEAIKWQSRVEQYQIQQDSVSFVSQLKTVR